MPQVARILCNARQRPQISNERLNPCYRFTSYHVPYPHSIREDHRPPNVNNTQDGNHAPSLHSDREALNSHSQSSYYVPKPRNARKILVPKGLKTYNRCYDLALQTSTRKPLTTAELGIAAACNLPRISRPTTDAPTSLYRLATDSPSRQLGNSTYQTATEFRRFSTSNLQAYNARNDLPLQVCHPYRLATDSPSRQLQWELQQLAISSQEQFIAQLGREDREREVLHRKALSEAST